VCPWNQQGEASRAASILHPDLCELLELSESRFHARFHHTALSRPRREGLARNAAVALGNSGNAAAVPHLARALREDASALVRGHAAWALGAIGGATARSVLERARGDADEGVRQEVEAALN
jgi:epoxyqueuosine reductase